MQAAQRADVGAAVDVARRAGEAQRVHPEELVRVDAFKVVDSTVKITGEFGNGRDEGRIVTLELPLREAAVFADVHKGDNAQWASVAAKLEAHVAAAKQTQRGTPLSGVAATGELAATTSDAATLAAASSDATAVPATAPAAA